MAPTYQRIRQWRRARRAREGARMEEISEKSTLLRLDTRGRHYAYGRCSVMYNVGLPTNCSTELLLLLSGSYLPVFTAETLLPGPHFSVHYYCCMLLSGPTLLLLANNLWMA